MAQQLVTLDSLRSYARGLDERVADKNKYSDAWIDAKINAGYELCATKRQFFHNEEVLPLKQYIIDGTLEFEVEMGEDVAGWKFIQIDPKSATNYNSELSTPTTAITYKVGNDNKVLVTIVPGLDPSVGYSITFSYYFFPRTTSGDQYFSTDIYHAVRHGIASSVYDALRDYEKRDNFDTQLDYNAKTATNGLDYDAGGITKSNWIDI